MARLGGVLAIAAAPGQGTTIEVRVTLRTAPGDVAAGSAARRGAADARGDA